MRGVAENNATGEAGDAASAILAVSKTGYMTGYYLYNLGTGACLGAWYFLFPFHHTNPFNSLLFTQ